ncbi:MAG: cyclodeaminase/cyclohydrolase family protein [Caldiserica bacterium]|nr:cyclodeaminase/cyclohydrolase family protein [Caldisericota bacterium]
MRDKSIEQFTQELWSSAPVPGGGGASALVGAVGAALAGMVANLTKGKKKYENVQEDVIRIASHAASLSKSLLELIEEDAEVFEPLSQAYSLPKDTEEQREAREKILEEALEKACSVPIKIMEKCLEALSLLEELTEKGTRIAISDVGVGATFIEAALQGASLNVFINTKLMRNPEKAGEFNKRAQEILDDGIPRAEAVFQKVLSLVKV